MFDDLLLDEFIVNPDLVIIWMRRFEHESI